MIQINNVSFGYTSQNPLFKQLSMHLQTGALYGLLGRNGAGKTTLLKIICGLLFPQNGSCSVLGFVPKRRSPDFLQYVCYIPEELPSWSCTINLFVKMYSGFYSEFNHEYFFSMLKEYAIDSRASFQSLSYGQKKKVILTFGIATSVKILILDEPTNGLDIPAKSLLRTQLMDILTPERIVIVSTHQVKDIEQILNRIIILDEGVVLLDASYEQINSSVEFVQSAAEPVKEGVLYTEKVPGGYVAIERNDTGNPTTIDLEVLFNAVISNPKLFNHIIKT